MSEGRIRILVSDPVHEAGVEVLRRQPEFEVVVKHKLSPEDLKKEMAETEALVVRSETKVTGEVLESAPRLRMVGRAGAGVDNIDVPVATRRGVLVANTPGGNTIAAAEHALALLLAMARNVPWAHASLTSGEWKRSKFIGHELLGKTLGLVGFGRIGREVGSRARSFGMNVIAFDPMVTPEKALEQGAELVDLSELLKRSDFISVHAALTPETRGMLGREQFAAMKKGVRIVNCARGALLSEAALVDALKEGRVAGAALDVFEKEPPDPGNPLLKMDGVIVTPHLGASTEEAQVNVSVAIAEQIRDYLLKGIVRNAVNAAAAAPEVMSEMAPYMRLAEKMGRFLVQLAHGAPSAIEIEYRGAITASDVKLATASAVKGALSVAVGDEVNAVNAMAIAKERGIGVTESKRGEGGDFVSSIVLRIKSGEGSRSVEGAIMGKDEPHVVAVDGLHLDVIPEGVMIAFDNVDTPGIVGKVGTILGKRNINIASLHMGRSAPGGRAMSVYSVDSPVLPDALKELTALAELSDVRVVTL